MDKPLWVREHSCPSCGFECDRDTNAAMNVLQRGFSKLGLGWPESTPVETSLPTDTADYQRVSAKCVVETGSLGAWPRGYSSRTGRQNSNSCSRTSTPSSLCMNTLTVDTVGGLASSTNTNTERVHKPSTESTKTMTISTRPTTGCSGHICFRSKTSSEHGHGQIALTSYGKSINLTCTGRRKAVV